MATEDYLMYRREEDEPKVYEEGFGWKAVFGGLFVGFLIVPGSMYMDLMLGQTLGDAAIWVTLILFIEIGKRCRMPLKKQEIFIIYSVAGGVLGMAATGLFQGFIVMQYFVQSEAAHMFEIADRIPIWVAPPPDSEAYRLRSLLHRDWWPHLTLMGIFLVWGRLNFYSLGYAVFRLTSDVERLPFPMAPIAAQGITALAESERETWRWQCFSIGSTIGLAYGLIYVAVPTITGIIFTRALTIIPVPWIDYTQNFQNILPAVPMVIGTNLGQLFVGFVLPFWMIVGSFTGAVIGQFIANPILYHAGVLQRWQPGMTWIETSMSNWLDFWLSFGIGTALGVAVVGFYEVGRHFYRTREQRKRGARLLPAPPGRGDIPVPLALLFYAVKTTGVIMICHYLVPKFPIWILLLFGFGYTPLMTYISARMVGLTGHGTGFPFVKEATFILSGYKGVDIWYAPIPLGDAGMGSQQFRVVELTGTKFTSYFKAMCFEIPLAVFCSLFFWSIIWKMGEIPSSAYPFANMMWPMQATMRCLWLTATTTGNQLFINAIKFDVAGYGLLYVLVMYPFLTLLNAPTLFLWGTIRGIAGNAFDAFPELTAALIGRYYLRTRFGEKKWFQYTPILAAGYGCGIGLISMVCIAIKLIDSAVSQLPF